ncbi:unnamed protein product [Spirodela intermedia]|uniref:Uncharacterized protein n=1 Tax=Spirodela intermedia TaxID=51605 RepID=A0A7I8JHN7_SPIIN|nr:unnamed protein product [Spirodela intermedia]CAA6669657.1 unnamed protein product [Spirodela intermedia]
MEATRSVLLLLPAVPFVPPVTVRRSISRLVGVLLLPTRFVPAHSSSSIGDYRGPKPKRNLVADWVSNNDEVARSLPIYVGGFALLAVLLNRAFSGIAPVADASSSQSRADILSLSLAVTDLLAGLVWLSIRPKYISPEVPEGVECRRIHSSLPDYAVHELLWAWTSLSDATCCRSLVVVYKNCCLLQIGIASEISSKDGNPTDIDVPCLTQGSLCQKAMQSGKQSYLANLSLYPGRVEFPFLPANTQALILQPIGDSGIAIIGGDTIRGFSSLDQAWITSISEKLDVTLCKLSQL